MNIYVYFNFNSGELTYMFFYHLSQQHVICMCSDFVIGLSKCGMGILVCA